MENRHQNVLAQLNEGLFDLASPSASEFKLPSISSTINPHCDADYSFAPDLLITPSLVHASTSALEGPFLDSQNTIRSTDEPSFGFNTTSTMAQQAHVSSCIEVTSFVSTITTPIGTPVCNFASNLSMGSNGSFSIRDVPVFTNGPSLSSVGFLPMRDEKAHVPISPNTSCFSSDGSIPLRNQQTHVPVLSASASFGSNDYFPRASQPTYNPNPSNTPRFGFKQQRPHVPSLAHTSLFGQDGLVSIRNQQNHVQSFPSRHCFSSEGSFPVKHQLTNHATFGKAYIPDSSGFFKMPNNLALSLIPTSAPCFDSNGSIPLRKHPRLDTTHTAISQLNPYSSLPMTNQQESFSSSSITKPDMYHLVSNKKQPPLSQIPITRHWTNNNDIHVCTICCKVFPTSQALGGHISSHSKARKKEAMLIGRTYNPDNNINLTWGRDRAFKHSYEIGNEESSSPCKVSKKESSLQGVVNKNEFKANNVDEQSDINHIKQVSEVEVNVESEVSSQEDGNAAEQGYPVKANTEFEEMN
uniref:C2H2-type domain-containing protein n=1 Tax=Nelumbo nucifera TaxID=4432 RepID=A0A822YHZ7_NELNU|nr:TPA_asm: hypothetical protein HUJ06_010943 [Nelumbo nucifera]